MVVAVWSVKGGVGVTSVVAMLALAHAERAEDTVIVDLDGDIPAVLGVEIAAETPGVTDWCALGRPDSSALARVEVDARPSLHFIPLGIRDLPSDASPLIEVLGSSQRNVIVDCGRPDESSLFVRQVIERAPMSLMVVRECFLNLRAAQSSLLRADGVVVIKEEGRHLGRADVELACGAPVVAEVAFDCTISRSIDVGLARARLPRLLLRRLGRLVSHAA